MNKVPQAQLQRATRELIKDVKIQHPAVSQRVFERMTIPLGDINTPTLHAFKLSAFNKFGTISYALLAHPSLGYHEYFDETKEKIVEVLSQFDWEKIQEEYQVRKDGDGEFITPTWENELAWDSSEKKQVHEFQVESRGKLFDFEIPLSEELVVTARCYRTTVNFGIAYNGEYIGENSWSQSGSGFNQKYKEVIKFITNLVEEGKSGDWKQYCKPIHQENRSQHYSPGYGHYTTYSFPIIASAEGVELMQDLVNPFK